jgi:hypothetical protein
MLTLIPTTATRYTNNKCILPFSKNIGGTGGCDCMATPMSTRNRANGSASVDRGRLKGDPPSPQTSCGVHFQDNEYYGIDQNLTISCRQPPLSFQEWQASGVDTGSKTWALPSDQDLLYFARQRLLLPNPGPVPGPPPPLPPPPHHNWPNTCEGRCGKGGHCCVGLISGCQQPNCDMGCLFGENTKTLAACLTMCSAAEGQCLFKVPRNTTVNMCQSCPNTEGCPGCDKHGACEEGCHNAYPSTVLMI